MQASDIELRPGTAPQFGDRDVHRKRRPIGARARHGVKCVGHPDDPRDERDRVVPQPVGISTPVDAFVMPTHGCQHLRMIAEQRRQNPFPDDGVIQDLAQLDQGQGPGFMQQFIWHADLSHVMQLSRQRHLVALRERKPQRLGNGHAIAAHPK